MRSDVRYIEAACGEHLDLVNLIHFGKLPDRKRRKRRISAADFRRFANRHNASLANK